MTERGLYEKGTLHNIPGCKLKDDIFQRSLMKETPGISGTTATPATTATTATPETPATAGTPGTPRLQNKLDNAHLGN